MNKKGDMVVTASSNCLKVWVTSNKLNKYVYQASFAVNSVQIARIIFNHDESELISFGWDHMIHIFKIDQKKRLFL